MSVSRIGFYVLAKSVGKLVDANKLESRLGISNGSINAIIQFFWRLCQRNVYSFGREQSTCYSESPRIMEPGTQVISPLASFINHSFMDSTT